MKYHHFELICGRPETLEPGPQNEVLSLWSSLEDVFRADTGLCTMQWNGIFVPLSYKYDVGWILLDAVAMVERLVADDKDLDLDVLFPSNGFHVAWHLSRRSGEISIDAEWRSVIGGLADLLRERTPLKVESERLISEWRHLFAVVVRAVEASRLDPSRIEGFDRLNDLACFRDDTE